MTSTTLQGGSQSGVSTSHVLRDQLHVSEEAFWSCVQNGARPDRGVRTPPRSSLPADLANLLHTRVGLTPDEIAALARDEAIARLQQHWTEPD